MIAYERHIISVLRAAPSYRPTASYYIPGARVYHRLPSSSAKPLPYGYIVFVLILTGYLLGCLMLATLRPGTSSRLPWELLAHELSDSTGVGISESDALLAPLPVDKAHVHARGPVLVTLRGFLL